MRLKKVVFAVSKWGNLGNHMLFSPQLGSVTMF